MGKHFQLIHLLDGSRIILGDKRLFGKHNGFYGLLHKELQKDWDERYSVPMLERKDGFKVGEHVLVKSTKCDGCRRAVVLDVNGEYSSMQERIYSVYLYDEGTLEDIEEPRVTMLNEARMQQLECRTVIVRLFGIVPAKIVVDLAKRSLNKAGEDEDSSYILTQDSSWSKMSNQQVAKWLQHPDLKYLGVVIRKSNNDGSVYGDIYRRLRSKTKDDPDPSQQPAEEGAAAEKKKEKHFLSDYIIAERLGLFNEDLANSQYKIRAESPVKVGYTGKYDEKALAATRKPLAVKKPDPEPRLKPVTLDLDDVEEDTFYDTSSSTLTPGPSPKSLKCDSFGDREPVLVRLSSLVASSEPDSSTSINPLVDIPGRLLVRARGMRAPYSRIQDFQLHSRIIRALEAIGIKEPLESHKIVAPNFIRGSDFIVIAPDGGTLDGKNKRALSYLLPLLRIVYDKYDSLSRMDYTEPPESIIIVNSYNTGVHLESYIHQLLNFSQDLPMRIKFLSKDTDRTNKNWKMVPGGINILIITMPYLASVMQTSEGPYLFTKLRFLIFEELELYLKKYKEEIITFISAARQNLEISFNSLPFQIMFSGSKWSVEMEHLYKEMVKDRAPMVLISGPNQVLRYAKIKWKVHYVEEETTRLESLKDLLRRNEISEAHKRIVVACSTPAIAYSVYEEALKSLGGVQVQLVISGYEADALNYALNLWRRNIPTVLIISDDMMHQVGITDATCLICYDSPPLQVQGGVKRSVAAERFGYLWNNIRHIEMEHAAMPQTQMPSARIPGSQDLVAHFLMTGEEHNFYQMYKFGCTLGEIAEFPEELKQLAMMMEQKSLQAVSMCQGTKLFGFCNHPDPESCQYRHFFSKKELSSPPSAPLTGEVEVRIIKCENPSSYQVELMRHYVFENGKRVCNHSYLNESRRRDKELAKYYHVDPMEVCRAGIKRLQSFKEGTWCAVHVKESNGDYYVRAKVDKILTRDKFDSPLTVRVSCIDSGTILNPSVSQLYELPVEFQKWTPLVINLILCNLKPTLGETEYRQSNEKKARSLTAGKIYNAKIWLSIENTVWVNPMVEYHVDPSTKRPYKGDSVRLVLINERIAEYNATHLEVLMESVNKHPGVYKGVTNIHELSGSSVSDELLMARKEFHHIGDPIQWAYVEKSSRSKFDPAKIVTQFGYDPWTFFGVHDKYFDVLKNLEKELHRCVKAYINGTGEDLRFVNYKDLFNKDFYEVGMVVAARERGDQTWMRGLIMRKYNEEKSSTGQVEFEVFFVDYGDTCYMSVDELFPIRHEFVTQLPFQIIAFKLDHVKPFGGSEDWSDEEKNVFLDLILKDQLSINVELMAYEDAEDMNSVPLPCRYYNAVALYKDNDLGSLLVERDLAEWKHGKENFISEVKDCMLEFYNRSVDEALQDEDDSEEELQDHNGNDALADFEETYDINVADFPDLFGLKSNGIIKVPAVPASNVDATAEVREELPPPPPPTTERRMEEVQPNTNCQPPPPAFSNNGLLYPQVFWRQTNNSFIMTINVTDIKEFELKVLEDKNTVNFKTLDMSPNYGFKIKLYGKVDREFSTILTGLNLRVTFKKKMEGHLWMRPLFSRDEKYAWFKGDLDHFSDEDESKDATQKSVIGDLVAAETEEDDDCSIDPELLTNSTDDEDDDFDDFLEE